MVETMPDAASPDANLPAKDASFPPPDDGYPYSRVLHELQSKAIRAQQGGGPAADDEEEKSESQHGSLRRGASSSSSWDLSADALLATLLHEFSSHVASRTYHVASEIRDLQNSVNHAGVDVAICQTEFMKRSADIFMEQVVGDDDDESESDSEEEGEEADDEKADKSAKPSEGERIEQADDDASDDSSAYIARLEAEERSAIADGMRALKLFYDPKRPRRASSGGSAASGGGEEEGMVAMDAEGDIIGDNCYYYPSAEEDGFNQRPLPFVVGSREFMESSCAGLGGDGGGGDDRGEE
mmetsp:Transcript_5550/g.12141  ORF Transcript_5550/g.12141 Transcript_5550/m.12141 type:complete len:298 (+) Transcript_5550:41-934(+)